MDGLPAPWFAQVAAERLTEVGQRQLALRPQARDLSANGFSTRIKPPGGTIELADDCAVLRVTGEVDLYTAPALRERIRGLAASGAVHVIADLGQVDFLDSTALGVLVGGLKRLLEDGGSLALVIKTPRILRVFELTALTKAFGISPSVAAAVSGASYWRKTAETQAGSVDEWCRRNGLS